MVACIYVREILRLAKKVLDCMSNVIALLCQCKTQEDRRMHNEGKLFWEIPRTLLVSGPETMCPVRHEHAELVRVAKR